MIKSEDKYGKPLMLPMISDEYNTFSTSKPKANVKFLLDQV